MRTVPFLAGVLVLWIIASCSPRLQPLVPLVVDGVSPGSGKGQLDFRFTAETGNDLLIEVTGFESEFEVISKSSERAETLLKSRIPYLRAVPVYQVIAAEPPNSDFTVSVTADHETRRAAIQVRVFELNEDTSAAKKRAQAFRLYSQAVVSTTSEAPELWRPRVSALNEAAKLFSEIGMTEQKLWSEFLVGYLTYFPIYDYHESIGIMEGVLQQAQAAGLDEIALMAMQIQAQAMLERDDGDSPEDVLQKNEKVQVLLDEAARVAGDLDMRFEAAWAINGKGIGFFYQDESVEALKNYEQALAMATELEDDYFVNMIRSNMALAHEDLGQGVEALGVLQDIRRDLDEIKETNLVINNLSEQGRIYKNFYRFPEAVETLTEAQDIARSIDASESTGRIKINLARAYYEMGMMERALSYANDARSEFEAANYGRGLREVYQISANVHRYLGNPEITFENREAQGQFLSSDLDRAHYSYDQALDLIANGGENDQEITELLKKGIGIAEISVDMPLQRMLRLELCRFTLLNPSAEHLCNFEELEEDYLALRSDVSPRIALSAMEDWAGIQDLVGNEEQAILIYGELLEEITFYRRVLPGVLGAWYWEKRTAVFESYLRLVILQDVVSGDGSRSLALLDRLRNAETGLGFNDVESRSADTDRLRGLLARKNRAETATEIEVLEREIDTVLLGNLRRERSDIPLSESRSLDRFLSELPADSSVLAFYFFPESAYRWEATPDGVSVTRIEAPDDLAGLIENTRKNLVVRGRKPPLEDLDKLGRLLLPPGPGSIETNLYLLAAGPLNGFPFDTLLLNGSFLAENHRIVNLQSLSAPGAVKERDQWPESIFLAGNPVSGGDALPELSATLQELESVAEAFPSAKITLVEGEELQLPPFKKSSFSRADLIHIASHSEINLAYPSLSAISLSSASRNSQATAFLTPIDIEGRELSAGLVVLSACETTGLNTFGLDTNLGFVTTFLSSGARAVIASLWALPDRETARLVEELYSALASGLDVESALSMVKRNRISRRNGGDLQLWAAFQLYRP